MTRRYGQGFTLLELLVAMAVFAVLSLITYGGLSQVLDTRQQLETERQKHQEVILAMMRLEDDIVQCRNRGIRLEDGNPAPAFAGREPDNRALAAATIECTRGGQTIIGRNAGSDLVRIGYRVNDQQILVRLIWPVLDRAPQTLPREQHILDNVESFEPRYFYNNKWYRTWPPTLPAGSKAPALPEGLELVLKQTDRPEILRLLRING